MNCPRGSKFVESIDAPSFAHIEEKMFKLLEKFIHRIGVENVLQVITDNANANVVTSKN